MVLQGFGEVAFENGFFGGRIPWVRQECGRGHHPLFSVAGHVSLSVGIRCSAEQATGKK